MRDGELRKIVTDICSGYPDNIIEAIVEDNADGFTITKAVWHFMSELRDNNIVIELHDAFGDIVTDRLYREVSNYLSR